MKQAEHIAAIRLAADLRRERIVRHVKSRGPIGTGDVARELRLGPSMIRKDLDKLAAEGRVEKVKPPSGGGDGWIVGGMR